MDGVFYLVLVFRLMASNPLFRHLLLLDLVVDDVAGGKLSVDVLHGDPHLYHEDQRMS